MADDGQPVDLTRLVAEHGDALYRYAYRLTGSSADAEDLTQQVFLAAQSNRDQLRQVNCPRSWLFVVLRNAYAKSRSKRTPSPATSFDYDLNNVPCDVPEQPLVDGDELQAALNRLPDEFKVVLLLFYFERRSYREIAEQLKLPLGTVMSRLSRGKSQLRSLLFAEVWSEEGPGWTTTFKPARISR